MSFFAAFSGTAMAALALRLLDLLAQRRRERIEDAITRELETELLDDPPDEPATAPQGVPFTAVPKRSDGFVPRIGLTVICPCGAVSVRHYAVRRQTVAPVCPICGCQGKPVEIEVE